MPRRSAGPVDPDLALQHTASLVGNLGFTVSLQHPLYHRRTACVWPGQPPCFLTRGHPHQTMASKLFLIWCTNLALLCAISVGIGLLLLLWLRVPGSISVYCQPPGVVGGTVRALQPQYVERHLPCLQHTLRTLISAIRQLPCSTARCNRCTSSTL